MTDGVKNLVIAILSVILGFILMSSYKCKGNSNENAIENSDISVERRCIENHSYYYHNVMYKGGLTLRVDDDGKPIKCTK